MNSIKLQTNGDPIDIVWSLLNPPCVQFEIGEMVLLIEFNSASEMIEFCTAHNFDYESKLTNT